MSGTNGRLKKSVDSDAPTRFITPPSSANFKGNKLSVQREGEDQTRTDTGKPSLKMVSETKENSLEVVPKTSPPHKTTMLHIENKDTETIRAPVSATKIARPPPFNQSAHGNASASSKRNFRDTWSSIAPSLKVLTPGEINEQVC